MRDPILAMVSTSDRGFAWTTDGRTNVTLRSFVRDLGRVHANKALACARTQALLMPAAPLPPPAPPPRPCNGGSARSGRGGRRPIAESSSDPERAVG